ncbi:DUF500-domain-containing protein [Aulographum hederae CBS 113979]|uniref:DUF500-domain-containing protein n=1 Tax=Aulographum hederae CBS 113979 TaxID=1176131 RepID=A0A6G1GXV6_9PEZI|nr:DUF500-domain-containing protein [Aulographum hederae CBS 113979]
MWSKTKTTSKAGFDKVWAWTDKLGAPVNRLSNKLGSEAFWPTTLDKESDKAARILRSFCKDGFYEEVMVKEPAGARDGKEEGPKQKQKVLKKIPSEVIKNAKGLAIFTTMRTGLWVSGAGGSGILVGRTESGEWSPPSGIMLHTAGLGFLVGVDIYDCVVVINTQQALDAFSKLRCTLGGEISAVAGPIGVGGVLETEVHKRQAPLFTYLKSRGFYAGVQIDGTIVIERTDENERFYGVKIGVADILAGKIRHPPFEIRHLMETIKAAQGDADVDASLIPSEPAPGEYEVEEDGHVFGIPDKEDPDPYGVLALENAGLEIREAGSQARASSEQFDFRPSPTSPIYTTYRKSMDGRSISRRSSWRKSTMSGNSAFDRPPMANSGTQTDDEGSTTTTHQPPGGASPESRASSLKSPRINGHMPHISETPSLQDLPDKNPEPAPASAPQSHPDPETKRQRDVTASVEDADDADDADTDEPVVVHSIQQAAAPQVITRARLVTVAKARAPPALPPRNPVRERIMKSADVAGELPATHSIGVGVGSGLTVGTGVGAGSSSEDPMSPRSERSFGSVSEGETLDKAVIERVGRMHVSEDRKDEGGFEDVALGETEMETSMPKIEVNGESDKTEEMARGRSLEQERREEKEDVFHSPLATPEDGRSPSPEGAGMGRNVWAKA